AVGEFVVIGIVGIGGEEGDGSGGGDDGVGGAGGGPGEGGVAAAAAVLVEEFEVIAFALTKGDGTGFLFGVAIPLAFADGERAGRDRAAVEFAFGGTDEQDGVVVAGDVEGV